MYIFVYIADIDHRLYLFFEIFLEARAAMEFTLSSFFVLLCFRCLLIYAGFPFRRTLVG